jgi:hypothetical protein
VIRQDVDENHVVRFPCPFCGAPCSATYVADDERRTVTVMVSSSHPQPACERFEFFLRPDRVN